MDSINGRINRLIGQIEGIRKMIVKKREPSEIVQQVLAARQALSKLGILIMKKEIAESSQKNPKKAERLIERVFRL